MLKPLPRLSHPAGNRIPPGQVMRGIFMSGRGFLGFIRFIQNKLRRIGSIAENIKPKVTGFLYRFVVIFNGCTDEIPDMIFCDKYMNESNNTLL
jgi:hypothetical protein